VLKTFFVFVVLENAGKVLEIF